MKFNNDNPQPYDSSNFMEHPVHRASMESFRKTVARNRFQYHDLPEEVTLFRQMLADPGRFQQLEPTEMLEYEATAYSFEDVFSGQRHDFFLAPEVKPETTHRKWYVPEMIDGSNTDPLFIEPEE